MTLSTVLNTQTIELGRERAVTVEARHGRIQAMHGSIWLTETGSRCDTFLSAGDEWRLSGRSVVLGAPGPARVRIVGTAAADRPAVVRAWRRLVRVARRQVQRLQLGAVEGPPWD